MPKSLKFCKDKERARKTRNRQRKKNYNKTSFYSEGRRKYLEKEDEMIIEHSMTDFELAHLIGRSVQAIQTRRHRLKKASKNDTTKL